MIQGKTNLSNITAGRDILVGIYQKKLWKKNENQTSLCDVYSISVKELVTKNKLIDLSKKITRLCVKDLLKMGFF